MSCAASDDEVQEIFTDQDCAALLLETGYDKPLTKLKLTDVEALISTMCDYHCLLKAKAAMDQFLEGLGCNGLTTYLQQYPDLVRPVLQMLPSTLDRSKNMYAHFHML